MNFFQVHFEIKLMNQYYKRNKVKTVLQIPNIFYN